MCFPGYSAVYAGAPTISWFNVQFYNQGGQCYTSYASLFLAANSQESCPTFPGTSVSEIAAYGVPLNKIVCTLSFLRCIHELFIYFIQVVGKYLLTSDASNGFVSASALAGYFLQAYQSLGWQVHEQRVLSFFLNWRVLLVGWCYVLGLENFNVSNMDSTGMAI